MPDDATLPQLSRASASANDPSSRYARSAPGWSLAPPVVLGVHAIFGSNCERAALDAFTSSRFLRSALVTRQADWSGIAALTINRGVRPAEQHRLGLALEAVGGRTSSELSFESISQRRSWLYATSWACRRLTATGLIRTVGVPLDDGKALERGGGCRFQLTVGMPASWMILRHFATSAEISALNSADEVGLGSAPILSIRWCKSGSAIDASTSLLRRSTIAGGVPFGARSPNHA